MSLRVAHIIDGIMGIVLFCIALNFINFALFWKGISLTIPIMACFCLAGIYVLYTNLTIPNLSFQLWTLFTVFYFIIAYLMLLVYQEIHHTVDVPYSIRLYLYNFIIILSTYRYIVFCIYRKRFEWVINFFTLVFTIGSLTVILAIPLGFYTIQYANLPPYLSFDRLAGIYFNPNAAGFVANITTVLGLATLLRAGSSKLLGMFSVVVGVLSMILSFSKTAILIFIVILFLMAFIYFLMYRKIDQPTRRITNIVFALLAYGLVQLGILISVFFSDLSRNQQERITQIETILSGKADKSSTSNRADLAELGLRKIGERPMLGSGMFTFVQMLESGNYTGDDVGVHNIFLRVWGEAGILPFMIFIAFFGVVFWLATAMPDAWLRFLTLSLLFTFIFFGSTNHNMLEDNLSGLIVSIICGCMVAKSPLLNTELT